MSYPTMHASEAHANATFRTLLWALSHPGNVQRLPASDVDGMRAIAATLIDLETSYYTPSPELDGQLRRTGARSRSAAEAMYHFYPSLEAGDLDTLRDAPVGSYAYPDEAATLVIGCTLGAGTPLVLRGPGIRNATELCVGGLPAMFWTLRAEAARYPLGWDVFLCDGDRVVGLPRTTSIEVR